MNQEKLWPADDVQRRPIETLFAYARNSRTHSDKQVDQIVASIREWGFTNPVLVGEDGTIIAGHGRVLAAKKIGLTELPVMVAKGWTESQKRAYVIADNKLGLNAGWDQDMLTVELSALAEDGFNLEMIGFDTSELDAMFAEAEKTEVGETDPDDIPEPPAEPISKLGDIWILGRHRIVCGDSTDADTVAKLLNGVEPHLMVTDPPYGVEYKPDWRYSLDKIKRATGDVKNDDRIGWSEAFALFPGDVVYVWHGSKQRVQLETDLNECGFELRSSIIWQKPHFVISRGDYHSQHEDCWYGVRKGKAGHWGGDRTQSTVWQIANGTFQGGKAKPEDAKTGHGTQKPVECMRRPIENNSSPGQAIYEPFSGSGSTIMGGEMTGRSVYAVELNPAYVDLAIIRWQLFCGKAAILEGDGRTYEQIKAGLDSFPSDVNVDDLSVASH